MNPKKQLRKWRIFARLDALFFSVANIDNQQMIFRSMLRSAHVIGQSFETRLGVLEKRTKESGSEIFTHRDRLNRLDRDLKHLEELFDLFRPCAMCGALVRIDDPSTVRITAQDSPVIQVVCKWDAPEHRTRKNSAPSREAHR